MIIQFLLIVIAAIIVFAGVFMVMRSLKRRQNADAPAINYDKNGIPIIPRHERNIIDQPDLDDTVGGETTIAPNRDYLHAIIEESSNHAKSISNDEHNEKTSADFARWQAEQEQQDQNELGQLTKTLYGQDDEQAHDHRESDAFSSLKSATDSLMPVIDTVDEPAFTDNSPILDQHLLEPVDEAQNSPLIHAQDNLNITILPNHHRDRPSALIRGQDLLGLIDKYGLRFGAMNMFHRYEHKDGTGILWFSMMGITDKGIAPFDPHSVATDTYNGVVLFLSLPHPQGLMGFDGMISIAYMMANDLDAMMLDENNDPITPEYKQHMRNYVRDYGA